MYSLVSCINVCCKGCWPELVLFIVILFFFFSAFFPLFAIFSVNDEPSWIENGLLQLLLGNNGEGKKENNEGRKRKPQVMIKQFIKYFSAPPNKKHTNFSLFFQVNTKINFSPSLQPPKYKILNTNTKYKSYLPLWQPTAPPLDRDSGIFLSFFKTTASLTLNKRCI